jgi:RimJ/RimL family protein N-acetyltransferase
VTRVLPRVPLTRAESDRRLAEVNASIDANDGIQWPALWGRGLATEAARAILTFGFEAMELHRVEAMVDPENLASLRVLEKLGFVREGRTREDYRFEDQFRDTVRLGLLRLDFS